ncbi:hypothetical protein [Acinetobacter ursingii]|uniref:hypothetical protein n=1 Tax=Acinetobacter ursingii TaxID=108980 RepID=UPI00124ED334|nr:hypothetical protein [Acinetobacter ursingii]
MALYDDLVDMVAIHVSPCPESAIYDATRHVVRDLCKETRIWTYDCQDKRITAEDDPVISLNIPEGSTIIHLWGINGRCGVYGEDSLDYYLSPPDKLMFNKPDRMVGKLVQPLVSLMPSMSSGEYPDFIMEYFSEGLISGIVSYLQMQPYRAWSQPNAAAPHQEKYQQTIKDAIQMRNNGLNISKVNRRIKPTFM